MTLLAHIAALADRQQRNSAAQALAAYLKLDAVVLLVRDPVVDAMVPAAGMAQTLRGGARWRAFVRQCRVDGRHEAEVDLPEGRLQAAVALSRNRMTLVLLGHVELQAEQWSVLDDAMPLLAAILTQEQAVIAAEAEAHESRDAALRAHALASALEAARAEGARLNAELREEHLRKDEFLAMLAHELRNPLAPIVTSVQVLKHPALSEDRRRRQIEIVQRQAAQMSRLVEDLLDVSRVSRGRIELKREPVDLRAILRAAVEASLSLMHSRGHRLTVQLPDDPLQLNADVVRLTQVFSNILQNAAKYTDPGGRIELAARAEGDRAVVSVRDNGIGIEPELLPRIFDLFMQVPVSIDRSQGGLGIGLTLVRLLVQLHDGEIAAESTGPGQGSCFTVRLPLPPVRLVSLPSPTATAAPLRQALRILVVDDNHDAADTLAHALQLQGHSVQCAYSGPAALQRAEEVDIDLVFLDLGLPQMDGYEVAQRMRRQQERHRPYLVALTGYGASRDRERSHTAGFDDHRVKPLSDADLHAVLLAAQAAGAHDMCAPLNGA
ncbi:hybrid sensor histidine kinase/response regulator [Ideonella sp. BN130291]|uniref:hybrid sensor histidine kinase/response regulator n=1 Tax=Ideonella sp. BN130291 TaxID=3112940 RepID=UPI002E26FCEB|nr:ATP-binding protein [Ideonella sp. BN130291]